MTQLHENSPMSRLNENIPMTQRNKSIPMTQQNEDSPFTRPTGFLENEKEHVPDKPYPEPS